MENIIEKIAKHYVLTEEDWKEINDVVEDAAGWGEEENPDEAERIWHYVLIHAIAKLEEFNLIQLLDVLGY
jgi:hypothetical protein